MLKFLIIAVILGQCFTKGKDITITDMTCTDPGCVFEKAVVGDKVNVVHTLSTKVTSVSPATCDATNSVCGTSESAFSWKIEGEVPATATKMVAGTSPEQTTYFVKTGEKQCPSDGSCTTPASVIISAAGAITTKTVVASSAFDKSTAKLFDILPDTDNFEAATGTDEAPLCTKDKICARKHTTTTQVVIKGVIPTGAQYLEFAPTGSSGGKERTYLTDDTTFTCPAGATCTDPEFVTSEQVTAATGKPVTLATATDDNYEAKLFSEKAVDPSPFADLVGGNCAADDICVTSSPTTPYKVSVTGEIKSLPTEVTANLEGDKTFVFKFSGASSMAIFAPVAALTTLLASMQ